MAKYTVYGTMAASVVGGTYEAKNKKQAIEMAENDEQANWMPQLCHQCAHEIELGEIYETQADKEEGE